MSSPLAQRLAQVKWGEIKLGELFSIETTQGFNKESLTEGDEFDYVTRSSLNNGILQPTGYVEDYDLNPSKCWSLGLLQMDFFYRERQWYAGQFVRKIIPKFEVTKGSIPFFTTILNKQKQNLLSVLVRDVNTTFVSSTVLVPVNSDGKPNFEFIDSFIAELEAERVAKLKAYLRNSGLDNYELCDKEQEMLLLSNHDREDGRYPIVVKKIHNNTKEFKISDIFNLTKGKRLTKANHLPGNTPFIGSTESNNGVTGYIGQDPLFNDKAITISYNGSVGQVFYQDQPFWASDDINVLFLKNHSLNRELFGYLGACLYKAGKSFSYTYKWNLDRMRETIISLPIQTNSAGLPIIDSSKTYHPEGFTPDWDFMETYIRAIEKLVIKNVVDFANKEI